MCLVTSCGLVRGARPVGNAGLGQDGGEELRMVIRATGADTSVERLIAARVECAMAAVERAAMPDLARDALRSLVALATCRHR